MVRLIMLQIYLTNIIFSSWTLLYSYDYIFFSLARCSPLKTMVFLKLWWNNQNKVVAHGFLFNLSPCLSFLIPLCSCMIFFIERYLEEPSIASYSNLPIPYLQFHTRYININMMMTFNQWHIMIYFRKFFFSLLSPNIILDKHLLFTKSNFN